MGPPRTLRPAIDSLCNCYRFARPVRDRNRGRAAGVVELVDTPGLGPGGGNALGVRVPPPAPCAVPTQAGGHGVAWRLKAI